MSLESCIENCKLSYEILKNLNQHTDLKLIEPYLENIVKDVYEIPFGEEVELIKIVRKYKDVSDEDKTAVSMSLYRVLENNKMIEMKFQDNKNNELSFKDVIQGMRVMKENDKNILINGKEYPVDKVEVIYKKLELDELMLGNNAKKKKRL